MSQDPGLMRWMHPQLVETANQMKRKGNSSLVMSGSWQNFFPSICKSVIKKKSKTTEMPLKENEKCQFVPQTKQK